MSSTAPVSRPVARTVAGLPDAIDDVAVAAVGTHRFLRRQWFAAAIDSYGGRARTVLVERGDAATIALPLVGLGPALLRMAQVPGCYWPFRSAPVAMAAKDGDFAALLTATGHAVRGFRLGPVYDDDPLLRGLLGATEATGWRALPRFIADSYLLDMAALRAEGGWPRGSTLRKNRHQEKNLSAQGMPDWSFVHGAGWSDTVFDALASIETASWIGTRTDGSDAKFTDAGHGRFWRAAARDPVLAEMMSVALLRMDGEPAAFSFDLNAGALKYAIANSYDTRFARHSPGKLLYYRNLVRALDDGIDRVDWGAGDSGYKRVIGAAPGPAIRDWLFLRPGLPALAGRLLAARWAGSGHRAASGPEADGE